MLESVFVYVFYVSLFPANGELSYTIYRTGIKPNNLNLKLKIGGTVDLPFYSDSEQELATPKNENAVNVLRMSNVTTAGYETDGGSKFTSKGKVGGYGGSLKPDSATSNATEASDYSDYERDDSRDSGTEKSVTNEDIKTAPKKLTEINKTTKVVHAKVRNDSMLKPMPDREVNRIRHENRTLQKETKHPGKQKIHHNPVIIPMNPPLRIPTTTMSTNKPKPHKVKDEEKIRNFSAHVYKQAIKAFESMKKKADPYTQTKIDSLAETYKEKFKEFVQRTRNTAIKTNQGAQNVILNTIDTSNLIMERIVNFLKTDMDGSGTSALRQGGASRLQKEVDTLKTTEFEHACKMFGICRSATGFRNELQDIISTLLSLPDDKLLQVNDAITEIIKDADLSAFTHSNPIKDRIKKAIKSQEGTDAATLRSNLEMLFGVLSKSRQPLIVDKGKAFEIPAVKRTIAFHSFLDAIEDALPPTEANRKEWSSIKNRLQIWRDGGILDVQDTFEALFNNVNSGVVKFETDSGKVRKLVRDIVNSVDDEEE